jgi:Uma2 family endonuclease
MVTHPQLWTVKDLKTLPDDGGWTRYEIVAGELLVTRAPHFRHQDAASNLHIYLGIWSKETQLGRVLETPGLVFTPQDAVIPDLIWISNDRLTNGTDEAGHFIVPPELVVEVLSPGDRSEQRDKEIKLQLYSQYDVREYWILSWQQQTLEIYRRANKQLEFTSILGVEDTLSSPLLPGFSILLAQVFS